MHIISNSLDAAGQEPNRSHDGARNKRGASQILPASPPVLHLHTFSKVSEERERCENADAEFYQRQDRRQNSHDAPQSGQHAINQALPKYPLIRPVDVILIGSIFLLGMFVLGIALGRI